MNATAVIPHEFNNMKIPLRKSDGYLNAARACKACGKDFYDYKRLQSTQEFLHTLSQTTGIPVTENPEPGIPGSENKFPKKGLLDVVQGGVPSLQGTWVHPYVAFNLAQWADPNFAVQVSIWLFEWYSSGKTPMQAAAPERPRPEPQISEGQMLLEKDRYIGMLEQTVNRQEKMIAWLETDNERLRATPDPRPRVTPDQTQQILAMDLAGCSPREISNAVGRCIETVRSVLRRKKKRAAQA